MPSPLAQKDAIPTARPIWIAKYDQNRSGAGPLSELSGARRAADAAALLLLLRFLASDSTESDIDEVAARYAAAEAEAAATAAAAATARRRNGLFCRCTSGENGADGAE
jgi:hypothetical protein